MNQLELIETMPKEVREAKFSADRIYRYTLKIQWDEEKPLVQFIGLNPSTADEVKDDPTIRRCKQFSKNWGYGGMIMTNLFAFRSTDPVPMKKHPQPIGEVLQGQNFENENDLQLWMAHHCCELTVAAWGNHGKHMNRGTAVRKLLGPLKAFRVTGAGEPEHPLYMPYSIELIELYV